MKKLMLVASLAIVAVAVVPIASASAFTGHCKIYGKAKFTGGTLPFAPPEQRGFEFNAENFAASLPEVLATEKTGCATETLEFQKVLKATVHGEGQLSCAVSNGKVEVKGKVTGEGEIEVAGKKVTFKFEFVAAAGAVPFTAVGPEITAAGTAEFLTPGNGEQKAETVTKCVKGEIVELPFEAVTAGKIGA